MYKEDKVFSAGCLSRAEGHHLASGGTWLSTVVARTAGMDLPAYLSIHRLFLSLLADVFTVSEAIGIANFRTVQLTLWEMCPSVH